MKTLIFEFLKLCELNDLKYELDSDGFYIESHFFHTCAFINMIDQDEQSWIRLVIHHESGYYRCDVDDIQDLESKFDYWMEGDDIEEDTLKEWSTYFVNS